MDLKQLKRFGTWINNKCFLSLEKVEPCWRDISSLHQAFIAPNIFSVRRYFSFQLTQRCCVGTLRRISRRQE